MWIPGYRRNLFHHHGLSENEFNFLPMSPSIAFLSPCQQISVKVDFGGADGDMACFRFNELLQASICA